MSRTTPSLAMLRKGETAIIRSIMPGAGTADIERKLLEFGFFENARVEVLHVGFPGADPMAVRVGECVVALRRREAEAVMVDTVLASVPAASSGFAPSNAQTVALPA